MDYWNVTVATRYQDWPLPSSIGGVARAFAEGNPLPGARRVVNTGQRGEVWRVGDIPTGEGRAGGRVLQQDEAEIAIGDGATREQVAAHGGFQTGSTGRGGRAWTREARSVPAYCAGSLREICCPPALVTPSPTAHTEMKISRIATGKL